MARKKKSKNSIIYVIALAVVCVAAVKIIDSHAESAPITIDQERSTAADSTAVLTSVKTADGRMVDVIRYEGFEVSFNPERHVPNFAAWEIRADRTDGPFTRKNVPFVADERVEGSATPDDYRRSGFDRGHLAPAADMKWSAQAMADCHYLTNICPQDNKLNSGAWSTVENKSRKWAKDYGRVVVVAGPVLTDVLTRTIGASKVAVPERFFKVILAPDADPPRAVAYVMPNSYVQGGADQTMTTIDRVEELTGYDFFWALPDDVENAVEAKSNLR